MVKARKKAKKSIRVQAKKQELTRLGSMLRSLGGLGGGALGTMVGQPTAGSSLGTSLGATLSKWLGSGDYTVSSNSIVSRTLKGTGSIPSMHQNDQSVIVRHKEFLGEVKGSIGFKVQSFYPLQPGDHNTFPWLAKIADGFQQYQIKGMVFHYIPTSGSAVSASNAALGSVMIQTSYRANEASPASKIEMLNEYWAAESVPSEAFCHPIECNPKENPFNIHYIRTKPVTGSDSILMYDLGTTYVATSGMQLNDTVVGDLWVTYEIEFKKPLIRSNIVQTPLYAMLSALSPTTSNFFGSGGIVNTADSSISVSAATRTIGFSKGITGTFSILLTVVATTTFTGQVDLGGTPTLVNCAFAPIDDFANGTSRSFVTTGGTSTIATFLCGISIINPGLEATITYTTGTWTGTAFRCSVLITTISDS